MRIGVALCLGLCSAALCACTPEHAPPDRPSSGSPILLDQGAGWTAAARADFYSRDQGSQIMPLAWLKALEQPSGTPFLADSLGRYGYLANPANNNFLPVGFTAAGPEGSEIAGMTCAACHTRQISVDGSEYRIDGGPAIVDFQSFLADLDTAVGAVLASDAAFQAFARQVLGATAQPADVAALRQAVELWHLRYHTLMTRALPAGALGPRKARRGGDDLQPPDRPRSGQAARLPDPREHPAGRGPRAVPVPVERRRAGPDAVAGLRRQWQPDPGPRPQSRRGLRGVRDLPSTQGQLAHPGRRLFERQLGQLRWPHEAGEARPQARPPALAVAGGRGHGRHGQGDLRAAGDAGRLHRMPRHHQGCGQVPRLPDLGDAGAERRHRHPGSSSCWAGPPGAARSRAPESRSSPRR